MDDADDERPFWERRMFQGAGAVVGLLAAVWLFIGAPTPWTVGTDLVDEELPASNTEIVLDASAAMGAPLGASGTRLDAAAAAVGQFAVPLSNEGLALRGSRGECTEVGELLVDFDENHNDDVRDAAREQQPGGKSNLTNAVLAAIDDFSDDDRFPNPDSPKRVVVFAGTVDGCHGEEAAEEIRQAVRHAGVDVVFKLVGVRVSDTSRRRLLTLEKALGPTASLAFFEREEDLGDVREWLLVDPGAGDCTDGVDSDGDELVDADDPGCTDGTEADPPGGGDCADGVDNDGDGLTDADDPGCDDGTEADAPAAECADGVDNDGDGVTDADDPGCDDGTEADAPAGECADGVDNDGDEVIDADDPGCTEGTKESDGP